MTASPDGYSPDTPVSEAYLDLLYEDYDAAPVYRDPKSQTDPVGYVSRRDLRADKELKVNDVVRPLDDEILVDRNAPLSQAIETLGDQRFFLVGSPDKIQGIVTRFDLNRLPVFMYLYDRFSEVEIGFRRLLRQEAPDWEEQTVQNIPSTTPSEIRVGPLSDAKFSHLRRIIEELGLDTYIIRDISGYAASLEDIVQLRNDVAHYRPIIHTMRDDSGVDDARSGTRLAAEYRLIEDCIRGLPLPESR